MNIISSDFNFLIPSYHHNLIRMGNKNDGGYILPEGIIKDSDAMLSFGYGYDCSFELDYINRSNNVVIIYDHTCGYLKLIKNFLKYLKRFILLRKSAKDVKLQYDKLINHHNFINYKMITFFKKKVVRQAKENIDVGINEIIQSKNYKNIILKCDIEGGEYEIMNELTKYNKKISCILVEFHQINKNLENFKDIINNLLKFYSIVHLHGNNYDSLIEGLNIPKTLEITFVKKDFLNTVEYVTKFPNNFLDNPNNPTIKDLEFEFKN